MQAQSRSKAVAAPAPESSSLLVRTLLAVLATAMLLFIMQPTVVRGQEKTTSHTVVAGESLWSLALEFYGDGQKWQELARLNGLGEAGEKQIVVGQVIKVPEHKSAAARKVALTPPPNTPRNALQRALQPSKPAASPPAGGALASQTAGKADAAPQAPAKTAAASPARAAAAASAQTKAATPARPSAAASAPSVASAPTPASGAEPAVAAAPAKFADPVASSSSRIWAVDLPVLREARGSEGSTIFQGRTYDAASTDSAVRAARPANRYRERSGEYSSAPYAVAAGSLAAAGTVGRRTGSAGGSFRDIDRLVLVDEAEITLPAGLSASVGTRLVSVETGPVLSGGGQVVVPTGVMEVIRMETGRPVVARVVRQSGLIQEGQNLVPLEGVGLANGVSATPVPRSATAPETEVTWVEGALLPTLQSYLLLGAGAKEGVKAGDEFALVTRQGLGADAIELRVALVRVVRVTPYGSSAIVVRQDQPRIAVGGAARIVARVP